MWKLSPDALDQHPHVESVAAWCQALHDDNAVWRNLRGAVTAIDGREPIAARIERRDGTMLDMTTMPLPDGATLVTFQDVTDTVNVERVLREKNDALEAADAIKIDFVHHVSYELRSPLTNIIGFANLLGGAAAAAGARRAGGGGGRGRAAGGAGAGARDRGDGDSRAGGGAAAEGGQD